MNKIRRTLDCIIAASFLTFAPFSLHAEAKNFKIRIECSEKIQKEILRYVVRLAVDLNDDGKPDKEGYEKLFGKLGIKYDKSSDSENYQEKIQKYIENVKTKEEYAEVLDKSWSMFTEKDGEMYLDELFKDFLPRALGKKSKP